MLQFGKVVTRLDMDVSIPDVQKGVSIAKDENARRWIFSLTNGGEPFEVPPNWYAILTGTKPNGNHIYNGTVIDGGKIIYDFSSEDEQLNTAVGSFPVQLEIYSNVGELVFSPKLWVSVFPNTSTAQEAARSSEDAFTAIGNFVASIDDVIDRVEEAELKMKNTTEESVGRYNSAISSINSWANQINSKADKAKTLGGYGITNAYTIDQVDAKLKVLKEKWGASLDVSMSPNNYQMTLCLRDEAGNVLSEGMVDLPLESLIMGATYADGVLYLKIKTEDETLENKEVQVNISDIIGGLVSEEEFRGEIKDIGKDLDTFKQALQEKISGFEKTLEEKGACANALKGSQSGESVTINDVSPLGHILGVKIRSKNLFDASRWVGHGGVVEVGGVACLEIPKQNITNSMQWDQFESYYDVPGDSSVVYTLTVRCPSENDETVRIYATKNKTGSTRQVCASRRGTAGSGQVYGGERLYAFGTGTCYLVLSAMQLELGTEATECAPRVSDLSAVGVIANGKTYPAAADGVVSGVQSEFPTMTLSADTPGVIIDCEYQKDINKAIEDGDYSGQESEAVAVCANALRGKKSGSVIGLTDVSPVPHTLDIKVKSKNLFDKSHWVNAKGEDTVNGVPCLKVGEEEWCYYVVPGDSSTAYTFTTRVYRSDGDTRVTNLKALQANGELRHLVAVQQLGNTVTAVVNGGEMLCFIGHGQENVCIDLTATQLELGTTATEYAPPDTDMNMANVKVKVQGKNLADVEAMRNLDRWQFVNYYYYPIYVGKGTTVTVSIKNKPELGKGVTIAIGFKEAHKGVAEGSFLYHNTSENLIKDTITVKSSDGYIYINLGNSGVSGTLQEAADEILFDNNLQVEINSGRTAYEPYIPPVEYAVEADGSVLGIKSASSTMTLMTDTDGAVIDCEYNRDINKAFTELYNALISLGGNV